MTSKFSSSARRFGRLTFLAAVAAAASACSSSLDRVPLAQAHPSAVSIEPYLVEVPVLDAVTEAEARRIETFARRFRSIGRGELTVAYPDDGAPALFVADVVAHVQGQGVHPSKIVTGAYSVAADGDRGVVLSFYGAAALASRCADSWGPSAPSATNARGDNLGCASRNNLAAMIANPRDLVEPQPLSPPSVRRRGLVLDAYAKGESTASERSMEPTATTN